MATDAEKAAEAAKKEAETEKALRKWHADRDKERRDELNKRSSS